MTDLENKQYSVKILAIYSIHVLETVMVKLILYAKDPQNQEKSRSI